MGPPRCLIPQRGIIILAFESMQPSTPRFFGGSVFASRVVALLVSGYRTQADPRAFTFQLLPEGLSGLRPNLILLLI